MPTRNPHEHVPGADPRHFFPADYFRELRRDEIFPGPERPIEVDLGCGDGRFLLEMAARFPERDFLGVERFLGRARKVCRKGGRLGLANLKVLRLESAYTLEWLLPEAAVSRVHLLFPDPWPKKKHHGRRLVTRAFCGGLRRVLVGGGEFLFKTDHGGYFDEAVERVRESGHFAERGWPEKGFFYPETDFERQWSEAGRTIHRARFVLLRTDEVGLGAEETDQGDAVP